MASSRTSEFWGIEIVGFFILGLPWMLLTVLGVTVMFLVIGWFVVGSKLAIKTQRLLLLAPWILITVFWICSAGFSATPRSRFGAVVTSTIPASVRDIRAAGFNSFLATRWLVRFTIATNDLQSIVSRHQLAESAPFNLQEIVQRDVFLQRLEWASNIPTSSQSRFFKRTVEHGQAVTTIFLIYDRATSQAWFIRSYQN